ncbi:MAG: histidinol-phosphate transaminase [Pseudomonadales bacterium]|nr:histidinol-phosphate transaminase [Pseudomonadales bacterium]
MQYERKNISAMQGYVSGEQPERPDIIKLNTNENPYPPGPAVARALAAISVDQLRRYPPPTALALRKSLAALHQVEVDNLLVTNGGDELLRLLLATFVEPGQSIAVADPSYSLYEVLAAAHGAEVQRIPLTPDWSLPASFAAQLNASGASLCFVVNPHAPSGSLTPAATLRQLAQEFRGVLVIDEAYVDFVDPALGHDCVPLIRDCDNVVLLRTFSKGYSLAGLRMAYGIGARTLIDPMQYKTKDSYNTDFIAQTLAHAAIADHAYAAATWRRVREERARIREQLHQRGLASPMSQSNFLLATVPAPHSAQTLYEGLKNVGILVRHFRIPGIDDKLRITIGTPEENDRLLTELDRLL